MKRHLAAVMMADVVAYSRLMEADELGTLTRVKALTEDLVGPAIAKHQGRIVKLLGDGLLAQFPSVADAIECGLSIQSDLNSVEGASEDEERIQLRIGVNLGDIIIDGSDIYGDGVNIAARLQTLADPGSICISGAAFDTVNGKLAEAFEDIGEQTVKNISRPIRVYRMTATRRPSVRASRQTPALSQPDKPSIAVLPFDNMSGDSEQDYLADGVVEALTAALSRIRSFFVIARNSAFVYKGKKVSIPEIGRELGVAYVLEGSVQRAGGRVRITVQLIETEAGAHIWAERYDGSTDDIFDLQDHIAEQVAGALQPSIRLAEIERIRRKPPQDMGAYDYTMRAFRHVWSLEKDDSKKALELILRALEIDPDYPLALALAAWCHAQSSVYTWVDDIETAKAEALSLAERAADLSSDDPLILTVLGTVHTFARNYGTARVMLERAVALDPNAAWAWSRLGWLAVYADRPAEATEYFEKALRLSPIDPMNFNNYAGLASAFQVAGDDGAAAEAFLRALNEKPNALWIHRNLAAAFLGAGRIDEARRSFEIMRQAFPSLTLARFKSAMVFSPRVLDRIGAQLSELGLPEK